MAGLNHASNASSIDAKGWIGIVLIAAQVILNGGVAFLLWPKLPRYKGANWFWLLSGPLSIFLTLVLAYLVVLAAGFGSTLHVVRYAVVSLLATGVILGIVLNSIMKT